MSELLREESFSLDDGLGLLRFRGEPGQTALYFNDRPIALLWDDNRGSIAQLVSWVGVLESGAESGVDVGSTLERLRWLTDGYIEPSAPLGEQLHPLLRVFPSGPLHLRHRVADGSFELVDVDALPGLAHFYPIDSFVTTRPASSLDAARVAAFVRALEEGRRPVAICTLAEGGMASFVLDGHHKLAAYDRLRLPPHLIEIEVERAPLEVGAERAFLPERRSQRRYDEARRRLRPMR